MKTPVNVKAESGLMQPQAREHLELPEAGGDKESFSPRACRGPVALLTPSFQTSGYRSVRE